MMKRPMSALGSTGLGSGSGNELNRSAGWRGRPWVRSSGIKEGLRGVWRDERGPRGMAATERARKIRKVDGRSIIMSVSL
jgi:hypothetical protein